MKTRILVVDDNAEFVEELKTYFHSNELSTVAGTASNGKEALDLLSRESFDCILLDLVMPVMDGFAFLENYKKSENIKIIAVSALSQDVFIAKAMNLGCDYYILKPTSCAIIEKKVHDCLAAKTGKRRYVNRSLEERITNIFMSVGIPPHIKGYQYLREAIKMSIEDPDIINSITKRLYPEVAYKFDTSPSKVERAIRHAIEVAWNRGKIENINTLFGVRIYGQNEKPTNGEFIALVADKMLLESV